MIPEIRRKLINDHPPRATGDFVLYWMVAQRRLRANFALDQALAWARELDKPLLILEALRCGYHWASDRLHHFVLGGMADNAAQAAAAGFDYFAFVEETPDQGRGLIETLAARAAVVVTDDYPCFFLPRLVEAAAPRIPTRFEAVDGNGILPLRAAPHAFARAVDLRRFLQKQLLSHWVDRPDPEPQGHDLRRIPALPSEWLARWPNRATNSRFAAPDPASLPIDHRVAKTATRGGAVAAARALQVFLERRLPRYQDERLDLNRRATSELSPYLHFGHLDTHEVVDALFQREDWHPGKISGVANGSKGGFWGLSAPAEALFDQLVTWRELGFNACAFLPGYDRYASLPTWARATLEKHAGDPRPWLYDLPALEAARTHDEVWNAAQRELVLEGRIHNYLRMLWGKKIIEWSGSPQLALEVMIELNNKYALDGRDPNSYSGIFWCLGRYDRPWFPERPIFGQIRYMSSESTRKKLKLGGYLARFGPLAFAGYETPTR